jgi:hypothetical protein
LGGRKVCRIYTHKDRIGKEIDRIRVDERTVRKITCHNRVDIKKHFPGCPYNELITIDDGTRQTP